MSVEVPEGRAGRIAWGVAGGIFGYFVTLIVAKAAFDIEKPAIDWMAAVGAMAIGVGAMALSSWLQRRLPPRHRKFLVASGLLFLVAMVLLYGRFVAH